MDTATHIYSLEDSMAALEQHVLAAEARAVGSEQRIHEATHEMSEMAGHLMFHLVYDRLE